MENRIHAYRGALDRLDRWVEGNRRPDGSWVQPSSPAGYFSLPPYACEVGRRDWAITTVRHVEESFVGADRTLQQGARDQMLPYVPSWLAWGASLAEAFRTYLIADRSGSHLPIAERWLLWLGGGA
jgi:hypothetical protein